jgi:hypothetical protein
MGQLKKFEAIKNPAGRRGRFLELKRGSVLTLLHYNFSVQHYTPACQVFWQHLYALSWLCAYKLLKMQRI